MRVNKKDNKQPLKNKYFKKFQKNAHYLILLTRLSYLNKKSFAISKIELCNFLFAIDICSDESIKMFYYKESSTG